MDKCFSRSLSKELSRQMHLRALRRLYAAEKRHADPDPLLEVGGVEVAQVFQHLLLDVEQYVPTSGNNVMHPHIPREALQDLHGASRVTSANGTNNSK